MRHFLFWDMHMERQCAPSIDKITFIFVWSHCRFTRVILFPSTFSCRSMNSISFERSSWKIEVLLIANIIQHLVVHDVSIQYDRSFTKGINSFSKAYKAVITKFTCPDWSWPRYYCEFESVSAYFIDSEQKSRIDGSVHIPLKICIRWSNKMFGGKMNMRVKEVRHGC